MVDLEFKRGKESAKIEGNIILGASEGCIKPFRIFCKELGADATLTPPLTSKSELDFEEEAVIAYVEKPTKKLLADLDKNANVIIIASELENISDILKNTTKPILAYTSPDEAEKVPAKVSGIVLNFTEEQEPDVKITKKLKKSFDKVLIQAKFETPEKMYNFLRDSDADGIVISEFAIYKPTIFEQAENYFEKGYYNKLTRKRREKVVARFGKLYSKYESDSEKLNEYNQRFLEE